MTILDYEFLQNYAMVSARPRSVLQPVFGKFLVLFCAIGLVFGGSPAKASHWVTALPGNQGLSCASGQACAIAQYEGFYGPYPGGICVQLGGTPRGDWDCVAHPNPSNPPYALNGYASLVCDAGETMGPEGCNPILGKSPPTCPSLAADPVNVKEGGLYESVTDYSIGTQNPLEFVRYFWTDRSTGYGTERYSRLGGGWRSNFDTGIAFTGSPTNPSNIYFSSYNGLTLHFQPQLNSSGNIYYVQLSSARQGCSTLYTESEMQR